jgi:hypothetical protein
MKTSVSIGAMMPTRRKPKYSERNLFQRYFAHHNFHMDWSDIKLEPPS